MASEGFLNFMQYWLNISALAKQIYFWNIFLDFWHFWNSCGFTTKPWLKSVQEPLVWFAGLASLICMLADLSLGYFLFKFEEKLGNFVQYGEWALMSFDGPKNLMSIDGPRKLSRVH